MSFATVAVIVGFCLCIGFVFGWWLRDTQVVPDDVRLRRAQSVAYNSQGRYREYKARCVSLEGALSELNRQLDEARRQNALLDAENQDMAELLHDYVSVNSCDLHKSQAFLVARVQHLKACGYSLTAIQRKIRGYSGGRAYELIKPIFEGNVSLHRKMVRNSKQGGGYEVHLCSCDDADWKAEQDIEGDGVDVYG